MPPDNINRTKAKTPITIFIINPVRFDDNAPKMTPINTPTKTSHCIHPNNGIIPITANGKTIRAIKIDNKFNITLIDVSPHLTEFIVTLIQQFCCRFLF